MAGALVSPDRALSRNASPSLPADAECQPFDAEFDHSDSLRCAGPAIRNVYFRGSGQTRPRALCAVNLQLLNRTVTGKLALLAPAMLCSRSP